MPVRQVSGEAGESSTSAEYRYWSCKHIKNAVIGATQREDINGEFKSRRSFLTPLVAGGGIEPPTLGL